MYKGGMLMEWLTCIRETIDYIENNLQNDIKIQTISDYFNISPFFLQHGFSVMTNCSIGEYIRNRRLYLAALDLKKSDDKVIDIAARYRYEKPDSFTRAFTRFHGYSPTQVRNGAEIRCFLPFKIVINIQGGEQIDYKLTQKEPFTIIGFERKFSFESAYDEIPKFWKEVFDKYSEVIYSTKEPGNVVEKAILDNQVAEYGVSVISDNPNYFTYIIAGRYIGGEIPKEMITLDFSESMWAVFDCHGPCPNSIQDHDEKIFDEWLPNNTYYELSGNAVIEYYFKNEDIKSPNYRSQIWVPIKSIDK